MGEKSLIETFEANLITAIKAKDRFTSTVLRGLKADIKNIQIKTGDRDKAASDELVISTLSSAAKRRRDSIEQYTAGGRDDLAETERRELELISAYLPRQMSAEEIREVVGAEIAKLGLDSPSQVGALMKVIMPLLKGKADGKLINQVAREILATEDSN